MSGRADGKQNRFSRICAGIVLALTLAFMAFLLPMSLIRTTGMSTGGVGGEIVSFNYDNFFLNAIVLSICTAAVYILRRMLEHISVRRVTAVLTAWVLVFGLAFVCSAKLQPSEDSYVVTFFARQAAQGDFSYYKEYFTFFPYQFGFVLYEELVFRAFNLVLPTAPEGFSALVLQGLNVVYLAVSYAAVIACTGHITKNAAVQKITAVLLLFFLPGVLFTTYMYGTIPGFACAVCAVLAFLRFHENGRIMDGALCAVLTALAVCLKLNCLIFFVALVIVWLVLLVKKPGWKSALCLALTVAAVLAAKDAPQRIYERRSGNDYGGGVPRLCWMAMGVSEGKSCSGWYERAYTTDVYAATGYDPAATAETARETIAARVEYFRQNPRECERFFSRKLLSQWNEPTYQGLWTNQVRKNYSEPGKLYELICQRFARRLTQLMNYFQQLVFLGFTLGLVLLWRKKDIKAALFPLIILGGLLYHLLFEAKSQYALSYIILMIPVAAYGFIRLSDFAAERSESRGKK